MNAPAYSERWQDRRRVLQLRPEQLLPERRLCEDQTAPRALPLRPRSRLTVWYRRQLRVHARVQADGRVARRLAVHRAQEAAYADIRREAASVFILYVSQVRRCVLVRMLIRA